MKIEQQYLSKAGFARHMLRLHVANLIAALNWAERGCLIQKAECARHRALIRAVRFELSHIKN